MPLIVQTWPIDRLIPYARNPRKNDEQVDRMCGAIREFGFRIPIVAKSDGTVVDGHLRLKAAQKLGLKEVPVALADELTDTQVKAFRLLANQSANWAEWDTELLNLELKDLKEAGFDTDIIGFDADIVPLPEEELQKEEENIYTDKIATPIYEPTGKEVNLDDCLNSDKEKYLLIQIENASDLSEDERNFLRAAATRHAIFNYENIAEYYASKASPTMQHLMEESGLVIIDKDRAIELGYVELSSRIQELMGGGV
ncbi:hypothetical protein B5F76_09205 [Desulfovibrio sp. An276]|uniref:ParB N-terminal domain-containing protein n=1 Tax=Desulfovibrio sp. An276 TaxID=1965618 RepID=UPI000B3AE399|nr:ParB N-terminal domain-containing protein [Desulfovibrio sp. An276]OUO51651.1 hypothetical protein B5F76_09205 [Desulfovibrio sp. An276]